MNTQQIKRNERQRNAFWKYVLRAPMDELAHYQKQIRAGMRKCSCDRPARRSTGLCRPCAAVAATPQRRLALMKRVRSRLIVALEKQNPKHERKAVA